MFQKKGGGRNMMFERESTKASENTNNKVMSSWISRVLDDLSTSDEYPDFTIRKVVLPKKKVCDDDKGTHMLEFVWRECKENPCVKIYRNELVFQLPKIKNVTYTERLCVQLEIPQREKIHQSPSSLGCCGGGIRELDCDYDERKFTGLTFNSLTKKVEFTYDVEEGKEQIITNETNIQFSLFVDGKNIPCETVKKTPCFPGPPEFMRGGDDPLFSTATTKIKCYNITINVHETYHWIFESEEVQNQLSYKNTAEYSSCFKKRTWCEFLCLYNKILQYYNMDRFCRFISVSDPSVLLFCKTSEGDNLHLPRRDIDILLLSSSTNHVVIKEFSPDQGGISLKSQGFKLFTVLVGGGIGRYIGPLEEVSISAKYVNKEGDQPLEHRNKGCLSSALGKIFSFDY